MRPLQRFTDEYLESCRGMTTDQVIEYLEDYRRLHLGKPAASRLISMKVPEDLLRAFRRRAELEGTRYQTKIKTLMRQWLLDEGPEDAGTSA